MNRIPLSTPTMHGEEMTFVQEAFQKNWVAPLGFHCDAFENEVASYINAGNDTARYALCVNTGTAALHLAVKLAGVKPGDRVFCSDMTFAATVNPICYEGGVPVFVDAERDTWNMDPVALERAFERYPDTKFVMLVHLYGTPVKAEEVAAICLKHNAVLIEDAAEALSAEYNGKKCGTFGRYSVFSFNGNKIITTSGGGMLLCDREEDRAKALFWATQAREPASWYEHKELGYNYRMSNVLAGIGRSQMRHLEEHRDCKEEIYRRYQKGLASLPVSMNPYLSSSQPNFWLSCLTVDEGCSVDPLKIIAVLEEHNIEARPIWKPMHLQPVFAGCDFVYAEESPVDEQIFARGLCLPSDIKMTAEEQQFVIDVIKSCF